MASTAMTVFIAAPRAGGLVLGLDDLLAAVVARRRDVVAQVRLARGGLDGDRGLVEVVVRPVHAALRRRLLVLLNGHVALLFSLRIYSGFFLRRSSAAKGDSLGAAVVRAAAFGSPCGSFSPSLRGTIGNASSTASSTRSRTSIGPSATT